MIETLARSLSRGLDVAVAAAAADALAATMRFEKVAAAWGDTLIENSIADIKRDMLRVAQCVHKEVTKDG